MKHSLFTFSEELLMLEKQYLTTVSWNGLMCSRLSELPTDLKGVTVFEMNGRADEIAVSIGNGRFKYWNVVERAKHLMLEGVLIKENGCLYGLTDSFSSILKNATPIKKAKNERANRIKSLYKLGVFTFDQALDRIQVEFLNREKAASFLA